MYYSVCYSYAVPVTRTIVYCRVSSDKQGMLKASKAEALLVVKLDRLTRTYGYRLAADGERLAPDPAEQALLAQARWLSKKTGRPFAPVQVQRMLA